MAGVPSGALCSQKLRDVLKCRDMYIVAKKSRLFGSICVPGSKSHTIRALLLAALAEGASRIKNPLPSADCLSAAAAVPLIGAEVDLSPGAEGEPGTEWVVRGAGAGAHLPDDVVDVGNSGSLLYFLSPICATFAPANVFTGDESIRSRPVLHLVDALNQLGADCFAARPGKDGCPLVVRGPAQGGFVRTAGDVSSQYVSGLMMAGIRLSGGVTIELSNPKETPYLTMTQKWLEKVGVSCSVSDDFRRIRVQSEKKTIGAFGTVVPSDWEAVAFPLVAALISEGSRVVIQNVDASGTQGDDRIVDALLSVGGKIEWNKADGTLSASSSRLSAQGLPSGGHRVALSPFPDAVCALAVAACFTEGTTVLEDAAVCRRKEIDRLSALRSELSKLGADVEEGDDFLVIRGHSPFNADGSKNAAFCLHGGTVESYGDHRMAMSLAVLGAGLPSGEVRVKDAECCKVSFPDFFGVMRRIGAEFA